MRCWSAPNADGGAAHPKVPREELLGLIRERNLVLRHHPLPYGGGFLIWAPGYASAGRVWMTPLYSTIPGNRLFGRSVSRCRSVLNVACMYSRNPAYPRIATS